MESPLSLTLSSPVEIWLLAENGFAFRVVRWDDFYSQKKFVVKIYDLIKINNDGKTMVQLKKQSAINQDDLLYRDLVTGNYLGVAHKSLDIFRIFVIPHG